jgi:hypothetical protein
MCVCVFVCTDDCFIAEFVKTKLVRTYTYSIYTTPCKKNWTHTRASTDVHALYSTSAHTRTREGGRFRIPVMVRVATMRDRGKKKGKKVTQ